jgi:hypothetical protein
VNVTRNMQIGLAALVLGLTPAAVAQAGSTTPAQRAEAVRSQAMNQRYHLGAYAPKASTGGNTAALRALEIRSQALNERYHLGKYAIVRQSNGFDWADAGVGGAAVLGLLLIGGGVALGVRRVRSERLTTA